MTVATILQPRPVALGGPRAMQVRRTLPHRELRMIGAWCFLDHYGPEKVADSGGMKVARHPHTGLATVSWLFEGAIDHLDSLGTSARVCPGELNLMTAGRGITHSEFSTAATEVLHGVQLWLALPDPARHRPPRFDHFRPSPFVLGDATVRVFLGRLEDASSPVVTDSEIVGAQIDLPAGGHLELPLDASFEYGVLADTGTVQIDDQPLAEHALAYVPAGQACLRLAAPEGARLLLIGGTPFTERIVMWWNFVGRNHAEIAQWRAEYQTEMGFEPGAASSRFGSFPEGTPPPLPAPPLPSTHLLPRG